MGVVFIEKFIGWKPEMSLILVNKSSVYIYSKAKVVNKNAVDKKVTLE